MIHFLPGEGSSFEHWCQMAESQGCKVVIFVDSDRKRQIDQHKVQEKHPGAKIVILPDNMEFENLVPDDIYFAALANYLKNDESQKKFSTSGTKRLN